MELREQLISAIDKAAVESGISDRKLSLLASGKEDTIRNLRRGAFPRVDTFESLCDVLGIEVSLDQRADFVDYRHLKKGFVYYSNDNRVFSPTKPAKAVRRIEEASAAVTADNDEYVNLPLMDIQVAAGDGSVVEHEIVEGHLAFRKDWLQEKGLFARNLTLIQADGKSMEPEIHDGDVLLINRADRVPKIGKIMVGLLNNHLIVKKLNKTADTWIMASTNQEYGMEILDDVNALIGHVVWRGGKI